VDSSNLGVLFFLQENRDYLLQEMGLRVPRCMGLDDVNVSILVKPQLSYSDNTCTTKWLELDMLIIYVSAEHSEKLSQTNF
jgi:hypothetical protein